jgi:hypothetical protein
MTPWYDGSGAPYGAAIDVQNSSVCRNNSPGCLRIEFYQQFTYVQIWGYFDSIELNLFSSISFWTKSASGSNSNPTIFFVYENSDTVRLSLCYLTLTPTSTATLP